MCDLLIFLHPHTCRAFTQYAILRLRGNVVIGGRRVQCSNKSYLLLLACLCLCLRIKGMLDVGERRTTALSRRPILDCKRLSCDGLPLRPNPHRTTLKIHRPRTHLAPRSQCESRHTTQNLRKGRLTQRVGRDVQVVRRMRPKSGLWHTGGYPRGYRMHGVLSTNYCRQIQ